MKNLQLQYEYLYRLAGELGYNQISSFEDIAAEVEILDSPNARLFIDAFLFYEKLTSPKYTQ